MINRRNPERWSKEKVLAQMRTRFLAGKPMHSTALLNEYPSLYSAARSYFGSFREAVKAAGLTFMYARRLMTRKEIVQKIQELYQRGESLRPKDLKDNEDKRYRILHNTATRKDRFGSWKSALKAAGINLQVAYPFLAWDKQKVIREIRLLKRAGARLNVSAITRSNGLLYHFARRRFGSWRQAIVAAGLSYHAISQKNRWNAAEIKKQICEHCEAGDSLKSAHIRHRHYRLYIAACKRYGSWWNAVSAAGLDCRALGLKPYRKLIPQHVADEFSNSPDMLSSTAVADIDMYGHAMTILCRERGVKI